MKNPITSKPLSFSKPRSAMRVSLFLIMSLIALTLGACSTLEAPFVTEDLAPLLTDADIEAALTDLAVTTEELIPLDLGVLEEGEVLEASDIEFEPDDLSAQAVLPGSSGYIAYIRKEWPVFEIWLANQNTDQKVRVYSGKRFISSVATSRDGNVIVFAMGSDWWCCNEDIYKYVVSTKQLTQLTYAPSRKHTDVSMTASGDTIVFSRLYDGKREVVIRTGDGHEKWLVSGNEMRGTISGNGTYLALIRTTKFPLGYHIQEVLRYHRPSNSYLNIATIGNVNDKSEMVSWPSINNRGSRIVWSHKGKSFARIMLRDLDAGSTKAVASPGSFIKVQLTSDGRFLTYHTYGAPSSNNIMTMDLVTGEVATAVHSNGNLGAVSTPFWQK